jgi:hypothetical protein
MTSVLVVSTSRHRKAALPADDKRRGTQVATVLQAYPQAGQEMRPGTLAGEASQEYSSGGFAVKSGQSGSSGRFLMSHS